MKLALVLLMFPLPVKICAY